MPRGKSKRRGGARTRGNNIGKRRRQGERKDEKDLPSVSGALEDDTEMNNDGLEETKKVVEEGNFKLDDVLEAVRKYNQEVKPVLEEFEKMKNLVEKHHPVRSFPPDSQDDNHDDMGLSEDETEKDDESAFWNMVKAKLRASAK